MPAIPTGCGIPTTTARLFPSLHHCCAAARSLEVTEIKVCVNRSCGKQGSWETLEVLSSIAPHGVAIASCGCLGRCGAGPNLVVLPGGCIVSHCGTPARASWLLADICGNEFDPWRNLEVLSLRKKGEAELEKGNASEALALLNQATELNPSGGLQFLYKARSVAKLGMGDNDGALEDAKEACKIAPYFPQGGPDALVESLPCVLEVTGSNQSLCKSQGESCLEFPFPRPHSVGASALGLRLPT